MRDSKWETLGPSWVKPEDSGDIFYIPFSNFPPATRAPGARPCMVFQVATEPFIGIPSEINPPGLCSSRSHTFRGSREEIGQSPVISFPRWRQPVEKFIDLLKREYIIRRPKGWPTRTYFSTQGTLS